MTVDDRNNLEMVLQPDTWPGYRLSMKRIIDGRLVEHGWVGRTVRPDHIRIATHGSGRLLAEFGSLEELAAAGWAVD